MDCFDACRKQCRRICRIPLAPRTEYLFFLVREDVPVYALPHFDGCVHLEGVSAHRITTLVHVVRAVRQMTGSVIQHSPFAVGNALRGGVDQHTHAGEQ